MCIRDRLAVFLTALFTRRGNAASAIGALLTGFAVITLLQPRIWLAVTQHDSVLAAPWRMLIATGLAFLVCAAGRPAPSAARL